MTTLTVQEIPRSGWEPALRRALNEKAINQLGPYAAIIAAPDEDHAVRRANAVLGMHRWGKGHVRAAPHDVVAALATFLNRATP